MDFFRHFWLFFVGDEDERRARAKETAKQQAKQEAEFHLQAHGDTDDLLDEFKNEDMAEAFFDDEFIN